MTKHNFKDHLNWLLKSNIAVPRYTLLATAHPSWITTNSDTDCQSQRTPTAYANSQNASSGGEIKTLKVSAPEREFIRPSLPASVLNGQGGDAMARLQSGSRSSNKPRLLSENIPVSLQTPASNTRVPGSSLRDQYTARYERQNEGISEM